ncbi:C-type lectin domain family 4 member G [Tupaia chinensis]|uniref:C-type lectin domain family 4 member G n=1 Tax=Tupaia chinensis TaxID=246437 RepID=L8Y105_TUPCH|nr:C-type lectin domain family 4 member G [Tupaia chinensis]
MDTSEYRKWGDQSEEAPGGSATQVQLQSARTELGEAQAKLIEQESALKELRERSVAFLLTLTPGIISTPLTPAVTKGLAEAGRDREDVRSELFRALEAVRFQNSSCQPCPKSWLPYQGSCYFFSVPKAAWEEAQRHCAGAGAHLVIVGDLEEQVFLTRNTRGRGYWLGLRAVRRARKIQSYQWVDGVPLSFSHWNQGEPNDSLGREDCVMMLHTGLWNDAPCDNERDGWICEKRSGC